MRFYKSLLIIGIATCVGLLCVWQEVELIKVGYQIDNTKLEITQLLDRNRALRYNVANLSSPSRLARELVARDLGLAPPDSLELVQLIEVLPRAGQSEVAPPTGRRSIFSYFSLKAQAEADQVK